VFVVLRLHGQLKVVPEGIFLIFTKSGIEHAEETFLRARVGGVCQQRSQHKSKVRKVSRVAPPPLRQRKCVFPLDIFFSIMVSAHLRKFPFRRFGRRDNSWTSLELHHRVAPACFGILRRQSPHCPCSPASVRTDPAGIQVRGCVDVRAHTREAREPRAYRSCAPLLPALPPPGPPSQFRTVGKKIAPNCPTPQTSALFSGPHRLSGSLGSS
jgi:hypothetical protein